MSPPPLKCHPPACPLCTAQGREQVVPILTQWDANMLPLALDQQLALINQALNDHDYLLCFDRADLVRDDETIFCVFTHLLATSRARLLLTSREELPLPRAAQIRLIGMADAEASQLLSELKAGLAPGQQRSSSPKRVATQCFYASPSSVCVGRDATALVAHWRVSRKWPHFARRRFKSFPHRRAPSRIAFGFPPACQPHDESWSSVLVTVRPAV